MKLTLNGKTYESDLSPLVEVSIGEARAIKRETGLTIMAWKDGLENLGRLDPDVLAALVFLLRSRAGEKVDWSEMDGLTISDLAAGLDFTLSDNDRAQIAQAGAKDWAELETSQHSGDPVATEPVTEDTVTA